MLFLLIYSRSTPITYPFPLSKKMLSQICVTGSFAGSMRLAFNHSPTYLCYAMKISVCRSLYFCLFFSTGLNGWLISSFIVISLRLLCYHVAFMVYDRLTDYVTMLCLYLLLIFVIFLLFVILIYSGAVLYSGAF